MQGSTVLKLIAALALGVFVGDVTTAKAAPSPPIFSAHGSACVGSKEIDRARARYGSAGVRNNATDGGLTVMCPGAYLDWGNVEVRGRLPQSGSVWCKMHMIDELGNILSPRNMIPTYRAPTGYWELVATVTTPGVFSVECGLPAMGTVSATVAHIRVF